MTEKEIQARIEKSTTSLFQTVFPRDTNHYDTLFGGTAMQLMDEVAFITATRFSRKKVVTVSSDSIDFKVPIPHGTIIELIGKVSKVGRTSLVVQVDVYIEKMYEEGRKHAISGNLSFVAIGDDKKPVSIMN